MKEAITHFQCSAGALSYLDVSHSHMLYYSGTSNKGRLCIKDTSNAIYTSVKIIKNEIRCRDDTVPKTVDTRSHCKVWLRACNNLLQPQKPRCREGVAEDCCMLSTIPCSGFLYLQFLARCHPYILFHDFYTCFTHFSLTVSIEGCLV